MARKSASKAALIVPEEGLLGWCMTSHHSTCPGRVQIWAPEDSRWTACSCACHTDHKQKIQEHK